MNIYFPMIDVFFLCFENYLKESSSCAYVCLSVKLNIDLTSFFFFHLPSGFAGRLYSYKRKIFFQISLRGSDFPFHNLPPYILLSHGYLGLLDFKASLPSDLFLFVL